MEAGPPKCTVPMPTFILHFSVEINRRMLICHCGCRLWRRRLPHLHISSAFWQRLAPFVQERDENAYFAVQSLVRRGENDWDWQRDYFSLLLTIPTQMGPWMCHRHPLMRASERRHTLHRLLHDSEAKVLIQQQEIWQHFKMNFVFLEMMKLMRWKTQEKHFAV